MCICVYVYMYISVYVCVYVHMYISIYEGLYIPRTNHQPTGGFAATAQMDLQFEGRSGWGW